MHSNTYPIIHASAHSQQQVLAGTKILQATINTATLQASFLLKVSHPYDTPILIHLVNNVQHV